MRRQKIESSQIGKSIISGDSPSSKQVAAKLAAEAAQHFFVLGLGGTGKGKKKRPSLNSYHSHKHTHTHTLAL